MSQEMLHEQVENVDHLVERYSVGEAIAQEVAAVEQGTGSIHAGGYLSEAERAPGVATATTEAGTDTWTRLGGQYGASDLFHQVYPVGEAAAISSADLNIPYGMKLEDARDLAVYGVVAGSEVVRPRPTEVFAPGNPEPGRDYLHTIVGVADVKSHGQQFVLEVATTKDKDGNVTSFAVNKRAWNAGQYPNDTGYRGQL